MEPKEKAKELINLFCDFADYQEDDCFTERQKLLINAKHCARASVNDSIKTLHQESVYLGFHYYKVIEYYEEVLIQIDLHENK